MVKPVVLIVEDEPIVRMFASDMIEQAGYEVVEAPDSAAAIAALEQRSDVRVVFTDVDMPGGVDGIELAARIRSRWPSIRIIIASGRPWPEDVARPADVVFFSKPYRQDRVLDAVGRMAA